MSRENQGTDGRERDVAALAEEIKDKRVAGREAREKALSSPRTEKNAGTENETRKNGRKRQSAAMREEGEERRRGDRERERERDKSTEERSEVARGSRRCSYSG